MARSFIDYIVTHLGAELDGDHALLDGRSTRLLICPIGLDTAEFTSALGTPTARDAEQRLITSAVGRQVIVGVDRLDYSKGLQERFLAYEQLLTTRPELREKLFLLQIAPPSRGDVPSYQQIRAELNALSGGINGEFASIDWVPVRYVNKGYAREELFGIYRASRVGLVTPLRDGMNLVAKEYVAAQDPEDPGVLVLSRFAGASVQLDAALIINPHSSEDMADAIARALVMPLEERRERHAAMLASVVKQDVRWWSARFIAALQPPQPSEDRPRLALAGGKG